MNWSSVLTRTLRKLCSSSGEAAWWWVRTEPSLACSAQTRPGAVYQLRAPSAANGVSMSRLESRPARNALWEYVFYVDIEGHRDEAPIKAALEELGRRSAYLKTLGSYPVAVY